MKTKLEELFSNEKLGEHFKRQYLKAQPLLDALSNQKIKHECTGPFELNYFNKILDSIKRYDLNIKPTYIHSSTSEFLDIEIDTGDYYNLDEGEIPSNIYIHREESSFCKKINFDVLASSEDDAISSVYFSLSPSILSSENYNSCGNDIDKIDDFIKKIPKNISPSNQFKLFSKKLKNDLKKHLPEITTSKTLELIAALKGYKSWNALAAYFKNKKNSCNYTDSKRLMKDSIQSFLHLHKSGHSFDLQERECVLFNVQAKINFSADGIFEIEVPVDQNRDKFIDATLLVNKDLFYTDLQRHSLSYCDISCDEINYRKIEAL